MSTVKVPLRFQILSGDQLIREEVIDEPVIKVGKLASSHLRLEDESVSRMHAVLEVAGPDEIEVIDLGSTQGTLVNGERVARCHLSSGDEISFGAVRVIVTLANQDETRVAPSPENAPGALGSGSPGLPEDIPVDLDPASPAAPETTNVGLAPQNETAPPAPVVFPPEPAPSAPAASVPAASVPAAPVPTASVPASGIPAPSIPAPTFAGVPAAGAPMQVSEVEEAGTRAVEVRASYRGVLKTTRYLSDPEVKSQGQRGRMMFIIGAVAMVISVATLVWMRGEIGHEKEAYEAWLAADNDPAKFVETKHSPLGDVLFLGGALIGLVLSYMGLKRWSSEQKSFTIGSGGSVDAPAPEGLVEGVHTLVAPQAADFVVNVTPAMRGDVSVGGQSAALEHYAQQNGPSFPVPSSGQVRIAAGDNEYLITATTKPLRLPVPFLTFSWAEQIYNVGTFAVVIIFLLMIRAIQPHGEALSLDMLDSDDRFANFLIKPPEEEEEEMPEWLKNAGDKAGGKGERHKGDEGKMGKETSKEKQGLYGLKGPKDNTDLRLAKEQAEEAAKTAGILGIMNASQGSHLASIFGADTALGSDAENVLGGLLGSQIGEAYGVGGLGVVGTGSGGGGTGEGTIGLGKLGTIGKGGGGGDGAGYGRGAGGLRGRKVRPPDVIPGRPAVRGQLDKEIIRRVIRRHINEVKFCYDQELEKQPELKGRIAVQFTIAPTGQVVTSVMQSSTIGSRRVESCVVKAVRRWEFPKPRGGGIVIVTYPFVFNPAGG